MSDGTSDERPADTAAAAGDHVATPGTSALLGAHQQGEPHSAPSPTELAARLGSVEVTLDRIAGLLSRLGPSLPVAPASVPPAPNLASMVPAAQAGRTPPPSSSEDRGGGSRTFLRLPARVAPSFAPPPDELATLLHHGPFSEAAQAALASQVSQQPGLLPRAAPVSFLALDPHSPFAPAGVTLAATLDPTHPVSLLRSLDAGHLARVFSADTTYHKWSSHAAQADAARLRLLTWSMQRIDSEVHSDSPDVDALRGTVRHVCEVLETYVVELTARVTGDLTGAAAAKLAQESLRGEVSTGSRATDAVLRSVKPMQLVGMLKQAGTLRLDHSTNNNGGGGSRNGGSRRNSDNSSSNGNGSSSGSVNGGNRSKGPETKKAAKADSSSNNGSASTLDG